MTDAGWERRNNEYLADALTWLRERLTALVEQDRSAAPPDPRPPLTPPPLPESEDSAAAPPGPPAESLASPAVTAPVTPTAGGDAGAPPEPTETAPRRRSRWSRLFRSGGESSAEPPVEEAAPPFEAPAEPPEVATPPMAAGPGPLPSAEELGEPAPADGPYAPAPAISELSPADSADASAAVGDEPPPAHIELARRLGLSNFERDVILLAVGAELDSRIMTLCGQAQSAHAGSYPTFGLALRLFDGGAWDALAPHRPLRRLRLVRLDGDTGAVNARVRPEERIVNYIKGLDHLDEGLAVLLAPMRTGEGSVRPTPSQMEVVDQIQRRIDADPDRPVVVNLLGADSVSKRLIAERAATGVGRYPLRVPVSNVPPPGRDLDTVIHLWERDSLLSPLALYLDASDDIGDPTPEARAGVDRLLSRAGGLVFLDSRDIWPTLDPSATALDVPGPTAAEQRSAWVSALGPSSAGLAGDLSAQFDLDVLAIRHLVDRHDGDREQLWSAALRSTRPRLDLLAQRVQPKATGKDLVVPAAVQDQIERIKEQVRHRATVHTDWGLTEQTSRGLGITALFAGESGTGKTLAAEVIAGELNLNLYRIDLSAVVSKYIGETEKNLRRLFDAAERGGTILFFDEADALFGKRSEVRDSHDRYANIEVNYLLQRMEGYRGLAILATNMKGALDHAFSRRLRFVVDFPFPGVVEREQIWRRAFVPRVRTDLLDFGQLAKLTLSGGSIHNIAVNATFAAAAAPDQALTMPMVLAAARMEYRKLGLPLNEMDFRFDVGTGGPLAVAALSGSSSGASR